MTGEQRQTLLGTRLHSKLGKVHRSTVIFVLLTAATILVWVAFYHGGGMSPAYAPSHDEELEVVRDGDKAVPDGGKLARGGGNVAAQRLQLAEEKEKMMGEKEKMVEEKEMMEEKEKMMEDKEKMIEEEEKMVEEKEKIAEKKEEVAKEKKEEVAKEKEKEKMVEEKEKMMEEKEEVVAEFPPKLPVPDVHPPIEPREYPTSHIHAGSNIFFVDTSCAFNYTPPDYSGSGGVVLTLRAACAVYSAAFVNPRHRVYLYQTCPLTHDYYNSSSEWVKRVLELENVYVVDLGRDPDSWFKGLPLNGVQDKIRESNWPTTHLSDALRITLLYKYGGTYMDTDVITLKPLDSLGVNWAVAESDQLVGSAVLNFEKGHRAATRMLELMKGRYNPQAWVSIGPGLVTAVLSEECNFTSRGALSGGYGYMEGCNFTLYPSNVAFAVSFPSHRLLFRSGGWEETKDRLAHSFLLHFWNKLSSGSVVEEGSAYDRLADTFCHNVYAHRHP